MYGKVVRVGDTIKVDVDSLFLRKVNKYKVLEASESWVEVLSDIGQPSFIRPQHVIVVP